MTVRFTSLPENRGEFHVVAYHPCGTVEVLYRTREFRSVAPMLVALQQAFQRGAREGLLGWPETPRPRGLFDLVDGDGRKMVSTTTPQALPVSVLERHPRLVSWDRPLYVTSSTVDARMALQAVRRAATLGALWSIGRNTLEDSHGSH